MAELAQRRIDTQRFSMSDRIVILNNTMQLRRLGIARTELFTRADHGDPDFGDFLLLYPHDHSWSRWGIGCCGRGVLLWRSASGASCGYFDTLAEALDALTPEAAPAAADAMPKRRRRLEPIRPLPICFTSW